HSADILRYLLVAPRPGTWRYGIAQCLCGLPLSDVARPRRREGDERNSGAAHPRLIISNGVGIRAHACTAAELSQGSDFRKQERAADDRFCGRCAPLRVRCFNRTCRIRHAKWDIPPAVDGEELVFQGILQLPDAALDLLSSGLCDSWKLRDQSS